jgi:hypothetical protein
MIAVFKKILSKITFQKDLESETGRPVRYIFSTFLIGLIALLSATVLMSNNNSYIKLVVSDDYMRQGESFVIDVYVNAKVAINAVDIEIQYQPESVEIISVDKAKSVLTIWTREPQFNNGVISFSGGTYRRGFIGEQPVVSIKARAKVSGQTEFRVAGVELLAGDGQGSKVPTEISGRSRTSFIIYDDNATDDRIEARIDVRVNPDIDGDGKVTLRDISAFMAAWHSKNAFYDFNNDGRMNFRDFSIILAEFFFSSGN